LEVWGVWAKGNPGIWASGEAAGLFSGDVTVDGALHVQAASVTEDAIQGTSAAPTHAGVSAIYTAGGFGVWAQAKTAGFFDGNVQVTGNLNMTGANKGTREIRVILYAKEPSYDSSA
jgi:hypothetical protein